MSGGAACPHWRLAGNGDNFRRIRRLSPNLATDAEFGDCIASVDKAYASLTHSQATNFAQDFIMLNKAKLKNLNH